MVGISVQNRSQNRKGSGDKKNRSSRAHCLTHLIRRARNIKTKYRVARLFSPREGAFAMQPSPAEMQAVSRGRLFPGRVGRKGTSARAAWCGRALDARGGGRYGVLWPDSESRFITDLPGLSADASSFHLLLRICPRRVRKKFPRRKKTFAAQMAEAEFFATWPRPFRSHCCEPSCRFDWNDALANGGYSPVVCGGCEPQTSTASEQNIANPSNISLESRKLSPNLDSDGPSDAG